MKKKLLIGAGAAAVAVAVMVLCYTMFFSGAGDICYYTQIDYSYTLPCYDKDGGEKDVTFGVSRKLRESAFLRLTVRPGRGVMDWAEVQYDELPPAVREHYTAPEH